MREIIVVQDEPFTSSSFLDPLYYIGIMSLYTIHDLVDKLTIGLTVRLVSVVLGLRSILVLLVEHGVLEHQGQSSLLSILFEGL
jgi:hypothetical protein